MACYVGCWLPWWKDLIDEGAILPTLCEGRSIFCWESTEVKYKLFLKVEMGKFDTFPFLYLYKQPFQNLEGMTVYLKGFKGNL